MIVAFGALGLIIGSFLNVLIVRYRVKGLGGRSECPRCGARIEWYDNIPVLSWLFLAGRCRSCREPISLQYPLVEIATASLFALVAGAPIPVGLVYKAVLCVIVALLIAIFVYDLYHTIIPDLWVYSFAALALVVMGPFFLALAPADAPIWSYVLAGPLAALPLFALWTVSGGRWMGFGDVKLALGMGWLLGPVLGIVSVFFAFIIGALVSLPLVALSSDRFASFVGRITPTRVSHKPRQGFTMKSEIPFGPFLISSCLIIWFIILYGIDLSGAPIVGSLWSSFWP